MTGFIKLSELPDHRTLVVNPAHIIALRPIGHEGGPATALTLVNADKPVYVRGAPEDISNAIGGYREFDAKSFYEDQ